MKSIKETCSCGGVFEVSDMNYRADVLAGLDALRDWRKNHIHEELNCKIREQREAKQ